MALLATTRRLVTIAGATVTEVIDLEVDGAVIALRDTFQIKRAARQTAMSGTGRRYQGEWAVTESHKNAEAGWNALVRGDTHNEVFSNAEAMIAALEPLYVPGLHLEWRPDNVSQSTFYEVRGPATWQPTFQWAQFQGARSMMVEVSVPVAPLARGELVTRSVSAFTAPNVVQLPSTVPGSAPALADITVGKASGQPTVAFGMLAWWERLPSPPSGYNPVFGIVEAESTLSGGTLTTWTPTSESTARGGSYLAATVSAAGSAVAQYGVSTAGLVGRTVDVEVWARVSKSANTVSPRCTVSAFTSGGSGARVYTGEHGSAGKSMTRPSSGGFAISNLGTLTLPLAGVSSSWTVEVKYEWAASASGTLGLDWLMLVPARQRACSPTGEPLDSHFPRFGPAGTGAFSKLIRSDLSGVLTTGAVASADSGLGGASIELPPGEVDVAVLLSDTMVDEPAGGTSVNSEEWTGTTLAVDVVPRFFAVNGG